MESDDFRGKEEDLVRPLKIKANSRDEFHKKLEAETKVEVEDIFRPLLNVLSGKYNK